MSDPLDGRIGEAWAGEVPERQPHQRRARAARLADRRGRRRRARPARGPGHVPFLACLGRRRRRAAADDRRQQVDDRGRRQLGPHHLGRGAARASRRACSTRVADGLLDAGEAADVVVLVAVWVDPAAHDETARAGGQPRGDARRDRRRAAAAVGRRRAALVDAPRGGGERLLRRATDRDAHRRARGAALRASRSTRRSAPPGTRCRARRVEATLVIVRADDGRAGYASGDDAARRGAARAACSSGSTRGGPRSCASCARPSTSTAAGRGPPRSRSGTSSARRARRAAVAAARRALGAAARVRVERRAGRAGGARAARGRRCATPACGRSSCASTTPTGATTSRSSRRCATRSAATSSCMVDANQGWRMAGDRSRALGRRDRDRSARGRSSRSASTGWRSRCRPPTSRATRALRPATSLRIAAGRDGAQACTRRATWCCAAAST